MSVIPKMKLQGVMSVLGRPPFERVVIWLLVEIILLISPFHPDADFLRDLPK